MKRLDGKIAIVSGAGSVGPGWGNGRATAVRFAEEGAKVFAVDRSEDALAETVALVRKAGGKIQTHLCDVTEGAAVFLAIQSCLKVHERIDILVNNVGGSAPGGPVEMSEEAWDAQLEYNQEHGITPTTIVKSVEEVMRTTSVADAASAPDVEELLPARAMGLDQEQLMEVLEKEMLEAASREEFELAAVFRDRLDELRLSAGKESSRAARSDRIADGAPGPDRGRRGRGRDHRRRR